MQRIFTIIEKKNEHQKVRDHRHYSGKYGVAAHSICNLRINVPNKVPVVFHNGSNYDCQSYHIKITKRI